MGLFDVFKRKPKSDAPPAIPREALMPWVHRRSHLELLKAFQVQRGIPPMSVITTQSEALAIAIAVMTEDGPVTVKPDELEQMGLSANEALVASLQNMMPLFSQPSMGGGLAIVETEREYAGAGVLLAGILANHLPLKGKPVMMLPEARVFFLAGEDDEEALAMMATMAEGAFDASADYRSLRAVRHDGGLFADWLPPEGHPLLPRFRALASKTRLREAQGFHGALGFRDRAPLAHLAVRSEAEGGAFVASLVRETSVMIPDDVERLVLLDSEDSSHPVLEVDFATYRSLFASSLEPLGVDETGQVVPAAVDGEEAGPAPMFWRARAPAFPTRRMLSFLKARTDWDRASPGAEDRETPAAELLAEWDRGAPIHVDVRPGGEVRLTHGDRRSATVPRDAALLHRIEALPTEDQAEFHNQVFAMELMAAIMAQDQAGLTHLDSARDKVEALLEQRGASRLPLVSSLVAEQLLQTLEDPTDELELMRIRMYEPTALFPVLRPRGFDELQRANVRGQVAHLSHEGKPLTVMEFARISEPFHDGMAIELVSDLGDSVTPLNAASFPEDMHATLRRSALLNLRAASQAPLIKLADGTWEAPWRDGFAASRLLLPELFASAPVAGERLLFAPSVNRVWLTGTGDLEGIKAVIAAAREYLASGEATTAYAWRELLSGRPWMLRDGRMEPWQLPANHPLTAELSNLDAEIERRRTNAGGQIEGFAQAARRPVPEAKA